MKKLNENRKKWLIQRNKAIMLQMRKRNNRKNNKKSGNIKSGKRKTSHKVNINAPEKFSIIENSNETLCFFNNVFEIIKKVKKMGEIFFDLSNIIYVTVDAIMYLTALIKNTRLIKAFKISCSGNMPRNREARLIIEKSGFYNYVIPKHTVRNYDSSKICIEQGEEADPELTGKICEFVHEKMKLSMIETKSLYPLIIELMTNTKQHAYNKNILMCNKWYIYVEKCDNYIQFVYLDTGAGIPNTIKTNFREKVDDFINNSDAYFIASALKGDFRTETQKSYRGKGLPEIYNRVSENHVSDFNIVSGKGLCHIDRSNIINEVKLDSNLVGTLFYWKFAKKEEES